MQEAITSIVSQLENDYVDLSFPQDENEMSALREIIKDYAEMNQYEVEL